MCAEMLQFSLVTQFTSVLTMTSSHLQLKFIFNSNGRKCYQVIVVIFKSIIHLNHYNNFLEFPYSKTSPSSALISFLIHSICQGLIIKETNFCLRSDFVLELVLICIILFSVHTVQPSPAQ